MDIKVKTKSHGPSLFRVPHSRRNEGGDTPKQRKIHQKLFNNHILQDKQLQTKFHVQV